MIGPNIGPNDVFSDDPVVVVLSPGGLDVARRLAAALGGAPVHGRAGRVSGADRSFDDAGPHLRRLFQDGRAIVGVCAAGALIRALAPVLADKRREPPVVAVAEDGSAVVPLLGGHHGANDLARRLATVLGCPAAVTTAGDLRFGVALDAPPRGWHLAAGGDVKGMMADLLAGHAVRLDGTAPWLADAPMPWAGGAERVIAATPKRLPPRPGALVYHPEVLAVGVGCERGADPGEAVALVRDALDGETLAEAAVAAVVSLDLKSDEPAVHAVAAALQRPARFFDAARLEAETPRLANPSDLVYRAVGCHGVAEAAALAAAGPDGRLVVSKRKSGRVTCAVAQAPAVVDGGRVGQPRGRLAIIGIGPGPAAWRTPEADGLLRRSDHVVGYDLYLDLLDDAIAGKKRHGHPLGAEEKRARVALDLAAAGATVALVSSGDAGIYALASLVFELLDTADRPDWRRIETVVSPGISAMQAAAARAGAPLGHDFCAISLSDLLTPWPVIERRVRAAAEGDFVIALYNPVSQRRRRQLADVRRLLLEHRPGATPVVLARNLGRAGEAVTVTTLAALTVDQVDMLTLVMIGADTTRAVSRGDGGRWVYTPRGYAGKAGSLIGAGSGGR